MAAVIRKVMMVTRAILLFLLAFSLPSLANSSRLVPNEAIVGTCSAKSPFIFSVELQPLMTGHLEIEQVDGDLAIKITLPEGIERNIDEFDFGTESITLIAERGGIYRFQVAPVRANASETRFSARLTEVRPIIASDYRHVRAEDLATESKSKALIVSNWDQSLKDAQSSLDLWVEFADGKAIARTYLRLGDLYIKKGIWDSAHSHYLEAEKLCAADAYLRCCAEAANNVGLTALDLGDLDEAESELLAARKAWRELGLPLIEARTNLNLGLLFWNSGEWQAALKQYDMARTIFEGRSPVLAATTLNNIGLVYLSMTDYDNASRYFLKALRIVASQNDGLRTEARIRINLGRARMLRGQLEAALDDQRISVQLMERIGDINGQAEALNNLGQVQLGRHHLPEAEESLSKAFSLYGSIHDESGLSSVYFQQGLLAAKENHLAEALQLLQRSLKIRYDRGLRDDAAETLYQLAILERESGQEDESLRHIEKAISLAQTLRTNVGGESFRAAYFAGKERYSEFYIDSLLSYRARDANDNMVGRAFQACEKARARALLDILSDDRVVLPNVDPELPTRLRSVQHQLNFKSARLATLSDTPDHTAIAAGLRQAIANLLTERLEVDSLIQTKDPYYQSSEAPNVVTIDEVRNLLLTGDDLLVEYSLGEARSFVWFISHKGVSVEQLPSRTQIEREARSLISLMGDIDERREYPEKELAFTRALSTLAKSLHLSFSEGSQPARIIIVADGILNRVPFAALTLTSSLRGSKEYKTALGLVSQVVQVPSASVLRILMGRQHNDVTLPISAAAFTDPVFDDFDSRVRSHEEAPKAPNIVERKPHGIPLARLVYSGTETEVIERLVPANRRWVLSGLQATKAAFLDGRISDYRLVLLSTHTLIDDRQPELSTIVLSMVDEKGRGIDGLLHLYDLHQVKLKSSMIILSACETAGGKELRGEGLIGISRTFLESGASSILASPLKIDAEASAFFVKAFLERILAGESATPSRALLDARRSLAHSARWNDPYYWGSFVLVSGLQ
jgi:CHAT domain-containing protein/tetratricopeptide (TPR) repeat protein